MQLEMLNYFSVSSATYKSWTHSLDQKIQEYLNAIGHVWEIKLSPVFLVNKKKQEYNITKLSQSQQEPLDFLFTFPWF